LFRTCFAFFPFFVCSLVALFIIRGFPFATIGVAWLFC
jgi:hypothetical protein